jgi:hypothetical protein
MQTTVFQGAAQAARHVDREVDFDIDNAREFIKTRLTCRAPRRPRETRHFRQVFRRFRQVLTVCAQLTIVSAMTGPTLILGICREIIS